MSRCCSFIEWRHFQYSVMNQLKFEVREGWRALGRLFEYRMLNSEGRRSKMEGLGSKVLGLMSKVEGRRSATVYLHSAETNSIVHIYKRSEWSYRKFIFKWKLFFESYENPVSLSVLYVTFKFELTAYIQYFLIIEDKSLLSRVVAF